MPQTPITITYLTQIIDSIIRSAEKEQEILSEEEFGVG